MPGASDRPPGAAWGVGQASRPAWSQTVLSQWHCHGPYYWAYHMTAVCGTYPPTISHIISGSGPRLSWSTRTSVVEVCTAQRAGLSAKLSHTAQWARPTDAAPWTLGSRRTPIQPAKRAICPRGHSRNYSLRVQGNYRIIIMITTDPESREK